MIIHALVVDETDGSVGAIEEEDVVVRATEGKGEEAEAADDTSVLAKETMPHRRAAAHDDAIPSNRKRNRAR